MEIIQIIYIFIATIAVIAEGPLWYKWWKADGKLLGINTYKDIRKHRLEYFQQLLINTLGSVIGWGIGFYLIDHLLVANNQIGWIDLALIFVAFYGMVGRLPDMLVNKFDKFFRLIKQ